MPYYGGTPMAADPKFLMERLMRNGMSRAQAAAVLGNLQRESGLASNNVNKNEGAYGLMQWRGDRFTQLQNFAQQKGTLWTDPGTQADFIAHEMNTTERKNAAPFMAARTVDEASAALKPVIRYGDKSGPERAMHARNFFGADDAAPETAAAPAASATPATAQPAVSRETMAYDDDQYRPPARGMRGGIQSIGEALGAYARNPQRAQANIAAFGNKLAGLGGGAPVAQAPAGAQPGRSALAAQLAGGQIPGTTSYTEPATGNRMVTGAPGRYSEGDVLNLGQAAPVATAPPGAPEPPRVPGGIPQPRPRPLTGPSLGQDDRLLGGGPTVADLGMGSLVDPMGYDYG